MNNKIATHWVIEYGSDCDGVSSRGHVWMFDDIDEAAKCADDANDWSDGMRYSIITSLDLLKAYCEEHMMIWTHYIYLK